MDQPVLRKARHYFDTVPRPSHVTFDDGTQQRRNYPWAHYVEARWHYAEPDTIKVTIGDCMIVILGHRLETLYKAIADHTLAWVCAHPDYAADAERAQDSFATEIRFLQAPAPPKRRGQIELDLGLEEPSPWP